MHRSKFLRHLGVASLASFAPLGVAAKNTSAKNLKEQVKITDVKSYLFKKACFVKVETDAGVSGWGESDGANKKLTPRYIEEALKQYVVGRDPFDSEAIWHEAYLKGLEAGIGGLHPGSLAGIDNALWDLKGKLLGMPVHKLLGGNGKDKIRVYASFGRDKGNYNYMTPGEVAKVGAGFVEQGYRAVKVRMQIRQENVNPYPDDIFACVAALRQAVGDDIILYVDFNNGYTPARAIEMGLRLYEKLNIAALEEPVFQQDYEGLGEVSRRLPIPVTAGEHEYNRWMIKDLLDIGGVEIVNADVIKCGGISECKKAASLTHAYGRQIMVHNAKPTLATAASLQLLASITNGATFQEYAGKRLHQNYGFLYELFDNYFTFADGFLHVPDGPGLGLVVNEKQMERKKLN